MAMTQAHLQTHQKETLKPGLFLKDFITICSYCNQIRDNQNGWHQFEHYRSDLYKPKVSHGICPRCFEEQMEIIKLITS
jgi:hypothetical protein